MSPINLIKVGSLSVINFLCRYFSTLLMGRYVYKDSCNSEAFSSPFSCTSPSRMLNAPVDLGFDCPLDLHCTYTRDQLLVALDFMNPNSVREGVKWLPDKQVDVLFVTLNKSDKEYSPTTMYNDYSINEELFHWQSQSTTTDTGSVGQRYIHHRERSSKVLLFVREFKSDLVGAAPYTFLGMANYVKHTGSRPMNITWKLDHPIPAKYLKKTQKLVVG